MAKGKKILLGIGLFFNLLFAALMLMCGYSGNVNPDTFAFAGILNMSFPIWVILSMAMLLLDLLFKRKLAFIPIVAMVLSWGPISTFSPLNVTSVKLSGAEQKLAFKVLTYNVLDFIDNQNIYPNGQNRTISYILSTDADVVCLQECEYLSPMEQYHVTASQIDSLKQRYPYYHIGTSGQSILSKYPITPINLGITSEDSRDIAAYLVEVSNRLITIYNVHLRSIGFTGDDKQLYRNLTSLDADHNLSQIRPQLISKLNEAARHRARQARLLKAHIEKNGGNVIVCGDFNDTPGCYAIRTISGDRMKDAYSENAFGPTITYNANRFYFRIDHVLYQGAFDAIYIKRNNLKSSDHYALLTTFLWQDN